MVSDTSPRKKAATAPKTVTEDDRYRYIGFDVFPKKTTKFWKSEAEAKKHAESIHMGDGLIGSERDFSFLHEKVMSKADRAVITLTAVLMIATVFMPWVSYRTLSATDFSLSWGGALGTLAGGLGTAFAGGMAVGIAALLGLVLLIGGPVVGLWSLAMLWTKAKSAEAYYLRLRLPLQLGYVFLLAALAICVLSFIGGRIPGMETWSMIDPGETFGFGTLLTLMSFGPYLIVALGMVAGVKSGDL